jgi:hypothetical protein
MDHKTRQRLYRTIESERNSKVIAYVTGDRQGLETQIGPEVIDLFVILLDKIGPTKRLSLLLHTNGGHTATAWRLINLLRSFCDDFEVIVPSKAMSAGTLMSLGANRIVMTKQAALGPIDPSLNHPLNPSIPMGNQMARVPVSVEAVRGYIDEIKRDLKSQDALTAVWVNLADKVHPLVLGEIFRQREQIRFLARQLVVNQVSDSKKQDKIIDFLCADSGSHDYTINRREAEKLGLVIEKPSVNFYKTLSKIHGSWVEELKILEPFSPQVVLGANPKINYSLTRGLIETPRGGCFGFLSEGELESTVVPNPLTGGMQTNITDQRTFEGWRKLS